MSETPVDRPPDTDEHRGEQIDSAAPGSRESGSRSLKAGGEFLRALGADLGAARARVRLSLAARRRRPTPTPTPMAGDIPPRSGIGRGIWRVSMVFFGALVICSGVISAAMLYVIFGSPLEQRHSDPGAPALRAEAPASPSVGPSAEAAIQPAPSPASAVDQQKPADQTKTDAQAGSNPPLPEPPGVASAAIPPAQPAPSSAGVAEQQKPTEQTMASAQTAPNRPLSAPPGVAPVAAEPIQPSPSSAGAAEQQKPTEEAKAEPPAGANQVQPARSSCSVDLCAATYKSFHAADCTYQPIGGGPRSICALGAQPGAPAPQISGAATEPSPKPTDTRAAAAVQPVSASAAPEPTGSQCNRSLCAATYKSFHAADCTYQPEGGGPRSLCELNKGPTDALEQPSQAATNSRHSASEADASRHSPFQAPPQAPSEADDVPDTGMMQQVAAPASFDAAGPQCNRSRCAATYQSFHASDCTYQPEGGGPRRLCEP